MATSAVKLMQAMALAAAQTMVLWSRTAILQQLVGSVAIAVQRGSAMSWLEGYDHSVSAAPQTTRCNVEVMDDDDEAGDQ